MIAIWVGVAVLGFLGAWFSYRLGLRAGTSKPRVAACLVGLCLSLFVAVFAIGMAANSGHDRFLVH